MLGELLSFGGGIVDNLFANSRQNDAQEFSAKQFATRYQTSVKDLQAAGLSPMLAYGQGPGSSPQSSAASAGNSFSQMGNVYNQSRMTSAQVANIEADTANKAAAGRLMDAQASAAMASAGQSNAQVGLIDSNVRKIEEEIKNIPLEGDRLRRAAELLFEQMKLTSQQTFNADRQYEVLNSTIRKLNAETQLLDFDVEAAERLGNVGRSSKELAPIVRALLDVWRTSRSK